MKQNYIPSPAHWKSMYTNPDFRGKWTPVDKVSISKIKVNKRLFSYQNEVDHETVKDIVKNFDSELWCPIMVNRDYSLLDGQHRLQVAARMGIKFIDVIVMDDRIN